MTDTQIKDYLKKYRIDSEEQLAKHIEELKRNTIPNNEIIFPLVDLLLNEKSVLLSFLAENKKQEMFTRTVTPFFLDEMLEAPLGSFGRRGRVINYSTRHKAREEGIFHKEIVGDLEGINRPFDTSVLMKAICDYKSDNRKELENNYPERLGWQIKRGRVINYNKEKDDVITSNNRGEKETMEYLQGLKYNNLKPSLDIVINRQFPKALQLIALATEYGHKKYIENDVNYLNYKSVKGGSQTYFDASARHSTDRNGLDESGLPHIIHAVWSSLAGLELWAEENNINVKEFTENFMKSLQD